MTIKTLLTGTALAAGLLGTAVHAERGEDGQVNILLWQAPSILNPYLSAGTKDMMAAALTLEPLVRFDSGGNMVPILVTEIPTVENGGVSKDLTSISYTLIDGLKWSDGTDVTAEDAVFTWAYCTAEDGGCSQTDYYAGVENVEAVDAKTIKIR